MTCHQPSSKSIFRQNFDENIRNLVISEANDSQYCILLLFYARHMFFFEKIVFFAIIIGMCAFLFD